MRHSRKRGLITAGILSIILFSGTAYAQLGYPITACGTLQRPLDCIYFVPFSGGAYLLDNYGTFQVGDTVQVTGYIYPDDQLQCWCFTFQSTCIRSNTITQAALPCYADGVCGSFDCNQYVDYSDWLLGSNYLEAGLYPLLCPEIADFDGHSLYTIHDLVMVQDKIYKHIGTPECPPLLPPLDPPVSANDYLSFKPTVYAAGLPKVAVTIGITVSDTSDWFNIPFAINVGGVRAAIDSIVQLDTWTVVEEIGNSVWFREWGTKEIPSAKYPLQQYDICRVVARVPTSDTDRPIEVVFDSLGPTQNGSPVNTPMIIRGYVDRPAVYPTIVPLVSCCVGVRGNIDTVGIVDLTDLSLLVAYLIGSVTDLPCPEEANVNGTGIIDLADLSALVSYLTGGGYVLPACG